MKDCTELVFILDGSGSMENLVEDTIGGFNQLIKEQKEQEGGCLVSTIIFNSDQHVLHDRMDVKEIKELTKEDYRPFGTTALIDALGRAIHHISNVHKYIRKEDVPEKTMFIITTDGMENASHQYSSNHVKRMIEDRKERFGWEFLFLGANIDAVEVASQYGINRNRAVKYANDSDGVELNYMSLSHTISEFRDDTIDDNWSKDINEYRKRKEHKDK